MNAFDDLKDDDDDFITINSSCHSSAVLEA
jgi:hypothetical protein